MISDGSVDQIDRSIDPPARQSGGGRQDTIRPESSTTRTLGRIRDPKAKHVDELMDKRHGCG